MIVIIVCILGGLLFLVAEQEDNGMQGNIPLQVQGKELRKVVEREIALNDKKHILQLRYYYNDDKDSDMPKCTKQITLNDKVIVTCQEQYLVQRNDEYNIINSYVISDVSSEEQYIILEQFDYINEYYMYYIIDSNAEILSVITDVAQIGERKVFANIGDNSQNNMYPQVIEDAIYLFTPININEQNGLNNICDWAKVKYSICEGIIYTEIVEIYDSSIINYL